MRNASRQTAYLGLMLALAVLFGYVETLLPSFFPVPGIKIGLANLVITAVLYLFSFRAAAAVSVLRVLIIGFLFGSLFSILYGLSGALFSLLAMELLKKTGKFGIAGVSACGGVMHNTGQLIAAAIVLPGLPFLQYLPFLMLSGLFFGTVTGIADEQILRRLPGAGRKNEL